MSTLRMTQFIRAPRARVYRALTDADSVQRWRVPDGMRSHVHFFDGREGGTYRVSLTYDAPDRTGKTSGHTDTHHGTFTKLVQDEVVVEVLEFETDNPALQGEMTIRFTLREVPGGTELLAEHENVPDIVPPADNELGWKMSLGKLAKLVENG